MQRIETMLFPCKIALHCTFIVLIKDHYMHNIIIIIFIFLPLKYNQKLKDSEFFPNQAIHIGNFQPRSQCCLQILPLSSIYVLFDVN